MTLYCKLLSETARTPLECSKCSYQLFLAYPLEINPGERKLIDVGLILKFSSTADYYAITLSDENSRAFGLIVNDMNTLTVSDTAKLEFTVYNTSKTVIKMRTGECIAKIVFVPVTPLKIVEVEQFPENTLVFKRKYNSVIKNEEIWFKRQLSDDREGTIAKFLVDDETFMNNLTQYRTTSEFLGAKDPTKTETTWIINNLTDSIRARITETFSVYKKDAYKQPI